MMDFDFDRVITRQGTNALAAEGYAEYLFGGQSSPPLRLPENELLSMWVADMQFAAPDAAINAIRQRLEHPIFGYTMNFDDALYRAFADWCTRRYGWQVARETVQLSQGVIPALFGLVEYLCGPHDKVLSLSPAYGYFKHAALAKGRQWVSSPLRRQADGRYEVDWADFERKLSDPAVTLFFLCHPHNPSGRVWQADELRQMAELCFAHGVRIVSDEIHCDLTRSGVRHVPLASLFPERQDIITCMAVSKTFNLAGLMLAMVVIPDPQLRAVWQQRHYPFVNPLSLAAATGVYREGEAWLTALCRYLDDNFALVASYLAQHLPQAGFRIPEATYLAWVDLSAYFEPSINLTRFFLEQAGLILEGGEMFVDNGEGCIRLNIACPRSVLAQALQRLVAAVKTHQAAG